jgi:EAL domain-containing protein (putative c-di-GMP-specific phosphodiesterase class I)/CHASE2 domain-containing sensor protein
MAIALNKTKIGRKIGIFAALFGLLGAINFFEPAVLFLSVAQSKIAPKPVSGDVVVVGVDRDSVEKMGRWPWPRDKQAELFKAIDSYGPKAVYIDFAFQGTTTPKADAALRAALEGMKAPTYVAALASKGANGKVQHAFSHRDAVGDVPMVSAHTPVKFGYPWSYRYQVESDRGSLQTLSASAAGEMGAGQSATYRLDLSYDLKSIRQLSAGQVLGGKIDGANLRGKIIFVGLTDTTLGDAILTPAWNKQPGVLVQVVGTETLKSGVMPDFGWIAFFIAALLICAVNLHGAVLRYSAFVLGGGIAVIFCINTGLSMLKIGTDPFPASGLLLVTAISLGRYKTALVRARRNDQTGFFDMNGYFVEEVVSNAIVIAAFTKMPETKRQYHQSVGSDEIIKEIGRRLSTIVDERQLTHNADGQFLWEMPTVATQTLAAHLAGLKQLLAVPVVIDGRPVDIEIAFGVDRDVNENVQRRMERALQASREAMEGNAVFKISTTKNFSNHLRTAFAEEFETAVANGDIIIVLQPKQDIATGIVGSAEAILRWTHPAHGEISTADIVEMATQAGILEQVSTYHCQLAIEAAAKLTRVVRLFNVGIKISSTVITSEKFRTAMNSYFASYSCSRNSLTLQIVDPDIASYQPETLTIIAALSKAGVKIGLANFGLTSGDLDYFKHIKADEIVMPKSFTRELLGSNSNRIFIDAAIRIARDTGIITTAEGVEDRTIHSELKHMGCDRVQGKIIHIPMIYNDFVAKYLPPDHRKFG